MKIKQFIKKWNVAFEDKEQKHEFATEMKNDIKEIVKSYDEFLLDENDNVILPNQSFNALWCEFLKTQK